MADGHRPCGVGRAAQARRPSSAEPRCCPPRAPRGPANCHHATPWRRAAGTDERGAREPLSVDALEDEHSPGPSGPPAAPGAHWIKPNQPGGRTGTVWLFGERSSPKFTMIRSSPCDRARLTTGTGMSSITSQVAGLAGLDRPRRLVTHECGSGPFSAWKCVGELCFGRRRVPGSQEWTSRARAGGAGLS